MVKHQDGKYIRVSKPRHKDKATFDIERSKTAFSSKVSVPPGRHPHIPLHFPHGVHLKDVSEPNECERVSDEAARENCADSRQSGRVMLSPARPQSSTAF